MPAYDAGFSTPPAPVARVTLRNPNLAKSVTDVPMLIDSGADTSLIPSLVLRDILNLVYLILDSPRLVWEVVEDSSGKS